MSAHGRDKQHTREKCVYLPMLALLRRNSHHDQSRNSIRLEPKHTAECTLCVLPHGSSVRGGRFPPKCACGRVCTCGHALERARACVVCAQLTIQGCSVFYTTLVCGTKTVVSHPSRSDLRIFTQYGRAGCQPAHKNKRMSASAQKQTPTSKPDIIMSNKCMTVSGSQPI